MYLYVHRAAIKRANITFRIGDMFLLDKRPNVTY